MGIHVEFILFHGSEPEISCIKGGLGNQTRVTPSSQSGGPFRSGGECFAPCMYGALPLGEGGGAKHSPPGQT